MFFFTDLAVGYVRAGADDAGFRMDTAGTLHALGVRFRCGQSSHRVVRRCVRVFLRARLPCVSKRGDADMGNVVVCEFVEAARSGVYY